MLRDNHLQTYMLTTFDSHESQEQNLQVCCNTNTKYGPITLNRCKIRELTTAVCHVL